MFNFLKDNEKAIGTDFESRRQLQLSLSYSETDIFCSSMERVGE